jgi:hypothetical protein
LAGGFAQDSFAAHDGSVRQSWNDAGPPFREARSAAADCYVLDEKKEPIMLRARLAPFAVAGSLLLSAGCSTMSSTDFLHPFRSRNMSCPCPTCTSGGEYGDAGFSGGCCPTPGCATGSCGAVPLISNAHPSFVEGPTLFPPPPSPLLVPGTTMPLPGTTMPPVTGPRTAPLPPVVTVPHAIPTPSPP